MERRLKVILFIVCIIIVLSFGINLKKDDLKKSKTKLNRINNYKFELELLNREIDSLANKKEEILKDFILEKDINNFIEELNTFTNKNINIKNIERINEKDDIEKLHVFISSHSLQDGEVFLKNIIFNKRNVKLTNININRDDFNYIFEIVFEINLGFDTYE